MYDWLNKGGWAGEEIILEWVGKVWVRLEWVWWECEVNIEGYGMLAI